MGILVVLEIHVSQYGLEVLDCLEAIGILGWCDVPEVRDWRGP